MFFFENPQYDYGTMFRITIQDVEESMRPHIEILASAMQFHYICVLQYLFAFLNSKQVCYELNYYYSFSLTRIQRLMNVCNSPRVVEAELRLDFRSLIPCPQILPWGNISTRMVDSSGSRAEIIQPRAKSQRCFFCTHPHPPYTGKMRKKKHHWKGSRPPCNSSPCLCPCTRQPVLPEKYRPCHLGTALSLLLLENLFSVDYLHWARYCAYIISFHPHYKPMW